MVKAINAHILSRSDNVTNESKLFKIGTNYFTISFQKIYDDLGLGKIRPYNRFRSHILRKFHASALYNDDMSLNDVNDLQGKAKNKTNQAYFMINLEDLKYTYIEFVCCNHQHRSQKNSTSNHLNLSKYKMRKTN